MQAVRSGEFSIRKGIDTAPANLINHLQRIKLHQHTTLVRHESTNMASNTNSYSVKVIGANGQISLGKQFAGRQVLVEEQEDGVWLIRTATVIPDNERWLHQPQAAADFSRALAWALTHPASDEQTEAVLGDLESKS